MRRRELVLSVLLRPLGASLSRPGGNLTGVSRINVQVGATRLELLHEMVPDATLMRPQAQELINPAVEVPTDEFGDDVGHNSAARKSRFTQQRMVAILRKDREPVLASGPGRTVCDAAKASGIQMSEVRCRPRAATRCRIPSGGAPVRSAMLAAPGQLRHYPPGGFQGANALNGRKVLRCRTIRTATRTMLKVTETAC